LIVPIDRMLAKDGDFATLMKAAQGGDKVAYRRLLEAVAPRLRRIIGRRRTFLKPQDIEDLVQEILLSVHSVRATYDPGRPFLPWLMAITRHRLADGARRHARRANELIVGQLPETFPDEGANRLVQTYRDPEALLKAIRALPPGQRKAIEMLKLREMSLKEAAVSSGLTIAALKVAVHRGMCSLRKVLGAEG
jgi:RNA polymerase sigma-70 factor (ECF subfamily)